MPQSGSVKENLQQSGAALVARKWLSPKGIPVLVTVASILQAYRTHDASYSAVGDQTWRGVNANTFLV